MKNNTLLGKLFRNNKFILVISLVISFVIWISMGLDSGEEISKTITDIPISINLSDEATKDGLQIFSGNEVTASVSVSGNRVTLGTMTKADVQVVASQASTILAPGTYTLELTPKKSGVKSNYEFASSVTPAVVTVYVDRFKEVTLDIEPDLEYQVEKDYYAATVLSEPQITISGPEAEISKVEKAVVKGKLSGVLKDVKTLDTKIVLFDSKGNEVQSSLINMSVSSLTATINVLPKATIPLVVDTINNTTQNPKYTIEPSKITVAAPQETLQSLVKSGISVGTLDFSDVKNSKSDFSYKIELPSDCKNLSNITNATVSVDYSDYASKKFSVTKFDSINLSDKLDANIITTELNVTLIGPESELNKISASDITAVIDFANYNSANTTETDVTFSLGDSVKSSWVYGKYKANVSVSEK